MGPMGRLATRDCHHHETQLRGRNADTLSTTLKGTIPWMAPEADVSRLKRELYMVGFVWMVQVVKNVGILAAR